MFGLMNENVYMRNINIVNAIQLSENKCDNEKTEHTNASGFESLIQYIPVITLPKNFGPIMIVTGNPLFQECLYGYRPGQLTDQAGKDTRPQHFQRRGTPLVHELPMFTDILLCITSVCSVLTT